MGMNSGGAITATYESSRKSGKTFRMIEDAVARSRAGEHVYVLGVPKERVVALLEKILGSRAADSSPAFRWVNAYTLRVHDARAPIEVIENAGAIDWEKLSVPGVTYGNGELLVDHDVIERRLRLPLQMLRRYEPAPKVEPRRLTWWQRLVRFVGR